MPSDPRFETYKERTAEIQKASDQLDTNANVLTQRMLSYVRAYNLLYGNLIELAQLLQEGRGTPEQHLKWLMDSLARAEGIREATTPGPHATNN